MRKILTRVLGDPSQKQIKKLQPLVEEINSREDRMVQLSARKLAEQTAVLKRQLADGKTLDDILPDAFATVREASRRQLGLRHFDVQLLGGMVLHHGNIAEMRTGEGKTLVATLPVYLNALSGNSVHVVTVNDYLAQRDAGWMGEIYTFLGLSVGVIANGGRSFIYDPEILDEAHSDPRLQHFREAPKREVYECDVVYGTNNEFGFDYLRDNMASSKDKIVQGELHFAIVDEVDSILIDEARTPLIISAPAQKSVDTYRQFSTIAKRLQSPADYTVDEKQRAVSLTDEGVSKVEQLLGVDNLYDSEHIQAIFHLEQALKAEALFFKNKNYIVREGQVVIVDEFTGRLMPGRRYSEGLHQAIEAKEGVNVLQESMTLATISFQNYFRMYSKLAGMTGTAKTEEEEFQNIYNLDVVQIPTNKPTVRDDLTDRIYKTEDGKFQAIADDVAERHRQGQPVLIGSSSIEKNERLSQLLSSSKIPHEVLNAKNNEKEAEIIEAAGQHGAVTLATNIAGRGTDIVLGKGVTELGGLHVLGSERHESRRIDNQLRGRSGRQGDPGSTQFYVSLEDEIARVFGGERITNIMNSLGVDEHTPIENSMVAKSIESAQKRVESHNYDSRKNVLQYDDVMNRHREAIYTRRRQILEEKPLKEDILAMFDRALLNREQHHVNEDGTPDREGLLKSVQSFLPYNATTVQKASDREIHDVLLRQAGREYKRREKEFGGDIMRRLERFVYLQAMDRLWMEHLESMDNLRQGIHLRGVGQRQPIVEYKKEARIMFDQLLASIDEEVATTIFRVAPRQESETETATELTEAAQHAQTSSGSRAQRAQRTVRKAETEKVGRNDLCPCGSGLKYKKCGLINAPEHKG